MWQSTAAHRLIQAGSYFANRRFNHGLRDPEEIQKARLREILKRAAATDYGRRYGVFESMSYHEFRERLPIVTYGELEAWVQSQASGRASMHPSCSRFQPSSGSTSRVKWIPYSAEFLHELDCAVGPWLTSLAEKYPRTQTGRHYWSISWIPTEQRSRLASTDDRDFFPLWKRVLWSLTQVGHPSVALTDTVHAASFATLVFLCGATDLSLLSVWSPTFVLSFLNEMKDQKELISQSLWLGKWVGPYADELVAKKIPHPGVNRVSAQLLQGWNGNLSGEFFMALWPNLALVSSWDSSTSELWADRLQRLLPQAQFEGKGLWATEGVVTIPYRNQKPAAVTSHFFEFRDLETGDIFPLWEVQVGQVVQPILTTGSGFLRYALQDRMLVTGKLGKTPTLEFLGRLDGADLVGEKISPQLATDVLQNIHLKLGTQAGVLIADGVNLQYSVLLEIPNDGLSLPLFEGTDHEIAQEIERICERELNGIFHYSLARELNQLKSVRVQLTDHFMRDYELAALRSGMIKGNLKYEPLLVLKGVE
jgi:hypothetical protein